MLNHYEKKIIFENVHIRYHGNGPYMEVLRVYLTDEIALLKFLRKSTFSSTFTKSGIF